MLKKKAFVKKSRKGNIIKVVREHYLRDDVSSGTPLDPDCPENDAKLAPDAQHYLLIDTNVALHQIDFLEHQGVDDVIVPTIVLEEVRHRNNSVYDRLRRLTAASSNRRFFVFLNEHHRHTYITKTQGESDNDRNDRAIRVAAKWYVDLLKRKMDVILLTDDVANRFKAEHELGLTAMSVVSYARSRTDCPELRDIAEKWEHDDDDQMEIEDGGDLKSKKKSERVIYSEHLPLSELKAGIQRGAYHQVRPLRKTARDEGMQGTITMSRSSWLTAMIDCESLDSIVKIVGDKNLNRAVSGDVVVFRLIDEEAQGSDISEESVPVEAAAKKFGKGVVEGSGAALKYPSAVVIGIIKRNWKSNGYCGSIKFPKERTDSAHSTRVTFKPMDRRIPPILIRTSQLKELLGKRVIVAMDEWPLGSRIPVGHYIRKLGDIGDKDTETEALLHENDVQSGPFTPAVHACVPALPWRIAPEDLTDPERKDLRELCICSIDPPGCKDIDDALHARPLDCGNYEIGVHIADVTHFLPPDTALDEEAARRGTTVYLVQKAVSMLPSALTEEICSLRGGTDRLAFSVIWELTPEGDIIPERTLFTKSIIRSRAALSYSEAQARIDDERIQDELTKNLRLLNRFGKIFRSRRREQGALELASAEVKFQIDSETQDPTDVAVYQTMDTNRLVEEMMLLANTTVAEKILRSFPFVSCLRRHPKPDSKKFKPLQAALKTEGFELDLSSNRSLSISLDKAIVQGDAFFNILVRMMTTRCMTEAEYFISGEHPRTDYVHYGLAMELYTHFTSPIRRYADVVVHRLLSASIGLCAVPASFKDVDVMKSLITNMNERHKKAQQASRDSASLYTLVYFRNKAVTEDGWITGFAGGMKTGLTVFIQKYGIEGRVLKINNHEAPAFELRSSTEAASLISGRLYRIFDRVRVHLEVSSVDEYHQELVLSLCEE